MKAAIYLNEGTTQVVLTPENEWERSALKMIEESDGETLRRYWGTFYDCQGGWYREQSYGYLRVRPTPDDSLIFRIDKRITESV